MEKNNTSNNHRAVWTTAELRYVKQHYGIISTAQIADALGRTVAAIRWVVRKHGFNLMESYRPWTGKEKEIIRTRFAAGDNIAQIMPLLPGRTRGAIYLMKDKLDAHSPRRWSDWERQILAQYYPTEGMAVVNRLTGRTKEAVRQTACAMGLRLRDREVRSVQKWTREEQQLLKTYQYLPLAELTVLFPGRSQQSVRKARIRLANRQKKNNGGQTAF